MLIIEPSPESTARMTISNMFLLYSYKYSQIIIPQNVNKLFDVNSASSQNMTKCSAIVYVELSKEACQFKMLFALFSCDVSPPLPSLLYTENQGRLTLLTRIMHVRHNIRLTIAARTLVSAIVTGAPELGRRLDHTSQVRSSYVSA
jgi:hypothetical protein